MCKVILHNKRINNSPNKPDCEIMKLVPAEDKHCRD